MKIFLRNFSCRLKATVLLYGLTMLAFPAMAYDIDIFTGTSGGTAAAPNVMFLVDNSSNWSTNATNTCVNNPTACPALPTTLTGQAKYNQSEKVGGNELNAMIASLTSLYTNPTGTPNLSVGLAMFTADGNLQNGYIRYGARNIGDPLMGPANFASLLSILSTIDPNDAPTKVNVGKKDESESLFELYQYFTNGSPGALPVSNSGLADYPGNGANAGTSSIQLDASGANYTAYQQASCGTGGTCNYRSPATACSKNYIIYIVNHDHKNNGVIGSASYEGTPSVPLTVNAPWTVSGVTDETRWIDEWAGFLYQNNITLYVIDVGGAVSPTNPYSLALQKAAKLGGGKYYALNSAASMSGPNSLTGNLNSIFIEIQAANSTFASVSLPINATNRAQNLNQVFIPMFRPDADASPLWKGNLKQYQLVVSNGSIELGDANGNVAVNPNTGFATPCAASFWTSDSSTYWQSVTQNPSPKGQCTTAATSVWSDLPDGSMVEKGGVAEVIRKGNNPAGSATWNLNRTVYTQPLAGGSLAAFSSTSPGLGAASGLSSSTTPTLAKMTNFILGVDVNNEYTTPSPPGVTSAPALLTRPSLHGDTIHSQPLPVNYNAVNESDPTKVYVYYGSNDGMLRAINGATGQEQWAFVAPEFYPKLTRLQTQSPLISYPNQPTSITPTPTPKDYFFDGSIGLYQNADNSKIWIYPSMRRGGRMLYAFDVTNPAAPTFKWKVGCPNLTNDTGCMMTSSMSSTASMSWTGTSVTSMGQTWSIPSVAARILGYSSPVVIVGGGYDACEDANTAMPSCTNSKGAMVNVIDADTGGLVASFPTGFGRSVVADVALIASATPGIIDHAYAVDTGGNIFRIDFKAGGPTTWDISRVAYTNGAGRKFMYAPALFQNRDNLVYLALGSGDREHPLPSQYPFSTPVVNRFYVYADNPTTTTETNLDATDTASNSIIFNVSPTASCTAPNILPESGNKGWYLDLNQYGLGEQTITSALIVGGMVTFSTNRAVTPSAGSCSTALGEARGYWLNLFSGSGAIGTIANCGGSLSSVFVGGGMPPSPVFANVQINNQTSPVVIGAAQRLGGASSPISPQQVGPTITSNRKTIFWKNTGADR